MPNAADSAGAAPAGFEYTATPFSLARPRVPLAPMYDIGKRDIPLDALGRVLGVHPVDQRVAILIGIPKNTIKSAPDGLDIEAILSEPPPRRRAALDAQVRSVLAPSVDAGDIRILRIAPLPQGVAWWRLEFDLDYANLRAGAIPFQNRTTRFRYR